MLLMTYDNAQYQAWHIKNATMMKLLKTEMKQNLMPCQSI